MARLELWPMVRSVLGETPFRPGPLVGTNFRRASDHRGVAGWGTLINSRCRAALTRENDQKGPVFGRLWGSGGIDSPWRERSLDGEPSIWSTSTRGSGAIDPVKGPGGMGKGGYKNHTEGSTPCTSSHRREKNMV